MIDPAAKELARRLGEALSRAGLKLVTAESCTGGGVGHAITAIPGSSGWYDRGYITYSNTAKMELLGVPASILERHGAVSLETAAAMAEGAVAASGADLAVSVTGIAGPDGGSPEKPVGTVCFGWHLRGQPTRTARHLFSGDRDAVRQASVLAALQGLLEIVTECRPG